MIRAIVSNLVLAAAFCSSAAYATGRCDNHSAISWVLGQTEQMVRVEGGSFRMGNENERPEERAAHLVAVSTFWIDKYEVTNRQFAAFVEATGYKTIAEKGIDRSLFPDLPDVFYRPGSMVFKTPDNSAEVQNGANWWSYVEGASWRHPRGPGSNIDGLNNHPVVQVAYEDALAYATWLGRDLPTEAEWEYAARGGLVGARFTWGEAYNPLEGWKANTWQGRFPFENDNNDGFDVTAPVGCFEANGYGLYDMAGNVWEYARDFWLPEHTKRPATDPVGPSLEAAARLSQSAFPSVVIKGGSWLCAPNFCLRYRPSARQPQELSLGTNHIGFRTVSRKNPG